ncbi:MAG: DNA polymerase III subunit alpha [Thermoguttaceae bacterium]|nr:DNA polymerase III subunit alpha [Thermoguttaceae bacterium]MDW8036420.1 DNA polymerase III subunit alpha [Thermoguttaceae bacterium]
MTYRPFVHLHCHSHYSLLDGAGRIDELVEQAKALRMNALALTDHGNLYGALEFYQKAKAVGIKPILGYEAYVAPGSRFQKEAAGQKESSFHLTLLAQNATGFRNLVKLASAAFLEGFYYRPRIDKQLLAERQEGIICLSGCASSELGRLLATGAEADLNRAVQVAGWFREVFGDRYFIEIQNNGMELQKAILQGAVQISRRTGIPLVATSDVHYVRPEDALTQDILLCISTGKTRNEPNRLRMETNEFYLRSPEEMYQVFSGLEEAVKRTQEIADSVEIELELGRRHFPVFTPPEGKSSEQFLRQLCLEGLQQRYADRPERWQNGQLAPEVLERLERELRVISKLGFANYFLIVWDFVRFARERGIAASARGSAVGSLVAYALGLSHVCPLEYDLLFERFLDENRQEAPDIDIDFDKERRGEVLAYVREKYGAENVAQIATFGRMAARAAIRDVGRALGMPIAKVDAVVAKVPEKLNITLDQALQQSEQLRREYDTNPEVRELLDLARRVEGLVRNVGTHAAAVVIADRPLTEYVPLQFSQDRKNAEVITQWAMGDVERAGLLKMDFLGLRNLTILSKAVRSIEQSIGHSIDPYRFPLDDGDTFDLLCRGETKGIFQLESDGIRDLLQRMQPDHFRDIIAVNALYRPGPLEGGMVDEYIQVKHGRKQAEYRHPIMKEILEETHGVMVYQEQVMRILNRLGGIGLADAYKCIKAISKKKLPIIAKYREQFVHGAQQQGLSRREAEEQFALVEKFAGYGFNKSHSTAYALIAYMTAYLKSHWPMQFMAALLSSDIPMRNFKRKDPVVRHLEECRRLQIEVLGPDVNRSEVEFTVWEGKISFGLAAVKGCGAAAASAIVQERHRGGPFQSLLDFCMRIDPAIVHRGAIESLIKAGAFDSLGIRRSQCMAMLDKFLQAGAAAAADRRTGQRSLFEEPTASYCSPADLLELPELPEWPLRERLSKEKEVLGFYLSSHPLEEYQKLLETYGSHTSTAAAKLPHRTEVRLCGMISSISWRNTRTSRPGSPTRYAIFDLEDMAGVIQCILWPEPCLQYGVLIQPEALVAITGYIERRPEEEEGTLIVTEVVPLEEAPAHYSRLVTLRVEERRLGIEGLQQLHQLLQSWPGSVPVELLLLLADGVKLRCRCTELQIRLTRQLQTELEKLLGPNSIAVIVKPARQPNRSASGVEKIPLRNNGRLRTAQ